MWVSLTWIVFDVVRLDGDGFGDYILFQIGNETPFYTLCNVKTLCVLSNGALFEAMFHHGTLGRSKVLLDAYKYRWILTLYTLFMSSCGPNVVVYVK